MKHVIAAVLFLATTAATARTRMQCAVENVGSDGARLNIIESSGGKLRANLIFGTTVSGTIYNIEETADGYVGAIRNHPEFSLVLELSPADAQNANIKGKAASLKAVYPAARSASGSEAVEVDFVCGKKITNRWQ